MILPHPAIARLQDMLPDCRVVGGSFHDRLPAFHDLEPSKRGEILQRERSIARSQLLAAAGVSPPLLRDEHGAPLWPAGVTGSITHKGTLIAIATTASAPPIRSLGIDLERVEPRDERLLHFVSPGPVPPAESTAASAAIALSAKEAAYKAIYQNDRRRPSFTDLSLRWMHAPQSGRLQAASDYEPDLSVAVERDGPWVVSVARIGRSISESP